MKNSTHKGIEFLGMGKKLPMPYAQCPKRRDGYPSPPMKGWNFSPLSINDQHSEGLFASEALSLTYFKSKYISSKIK
jgi:hypothetical protein